MCFFHDWVSVQIKYSMKIGILYQFGKLIAKQTKQKETKASHQRKRRQIRHLSPSSPLRTPRMTHLTTQIRVLLNPIGMVVVVSPTSHTKSCSSRISSTLPTNESPGSLHPNLVATARMGRATAPKRPLIAWFSKAPSRICSSSSSL